MSSSTISSDVRLERLGHYLQADPDNVRLLRDYAAEAWQQAEYRACATALARLRGIEPPTLDETLMLAQALRQDGRVADALSVLSEAASAWPDHPWLALECARCHFSQRAFEPALDALRLPAPDDPAAHEVHALRIRLLHHLGRLEEAAQLVDERLAAAAPQAAIPDAIARAALPLLMDLSRLEEAALLARALADAAPHDQPAPYEACEPLAAGALDANDPAAARAWTTRALAMRQDDGRVWLLDGLAHLAMSAPVAAIDALERASALMPGHAGSLLALGWACLAHHDLAAARTACEEAARVDPAFAETHGSLAVVAAMSGQRGDAETLVRKALRLDRQCASALWARHLLDGHTGPADVARLAAQVIANARRPLRPAPKPSTS